MTERSKAMAAGGVVFDGAGRVLLVEPKGHFDGYVWTLPKGRPEPGEDAEQAAVREVLEESGVQARVVAPIPGVYEGGTTLNLYFLMALVADTGRVGEESQSRRWATPAEAEQLLGLTRNAKGRARDLAVLRDALRLRQ